jgi:hypothetical protein
MVLQDNLDPAERSAQIAESLEPVISELHQRHPIQADLLSAFFRRILKAISALPLAPQDFRATAVPLFIEARELAAWLVDPQNGPSISEIQADIDLWVNSYVNSGFKGVAEYTETLRKAWLRKPRGHPVERRLAAVKALEAKLVDPSVSWNKLADRFYPSSKSGNIDSPGQALRQEVIALRKVLKKYGIPGWEPFVRHPNRKSMPRKAASSRDMRQE